MDLKNLSVFSMATKNMSYLSARQKVLAENIANANTPNYLAKDVHKPNFADELKHQMPLMTTNSKHFPINGSHNINNKIYTPNPTHALTLDGNGVDLENQLNEVSNTKGTYNEMLKIYNKTKSMIEASAKTTGV